MAESPDDLLTIQSAAALLGVSEVTLRRWDQTGKLRAHRHPGNRYRLYRRADVEALAGQLSDAGPPPRLGAAMASFVGRAAALAELEQAFAGGARLVTIMGPPGVGKTRLARRHAELLADADVPGGTWFCDATALRDEPALRAALVGLFGLAAGSTELLSAALARRRPLLLLIDNAEDLDLEARRLLPALCARVPPLRLLVTSREPLGLAGEALLELAPLGLPPPGAAAGAVLASEAVALLLARVRSARALARHPEELAALVRALDGLPLAIELAASQLGVLSPADVLARFGPLLEVEPPDRAPPRHRSLRGAIAASWRMLDDAGRSALAQCSLFAAGFTLDAAEHVLVGAPGTTPLGLVSGLRDRSLIAVRPGDGPGEERLVLLDSIRVFAGEHLEAETRAAAEERHARYYLARAEPWTAAVRARGDVVARRRLAQEQANLQVALAHRLAQARADDPAAALDALRVVLCLDAPLGQQGRWGELLALLDAAEPLARAAAGLPGALASAGVPGATARVPAGASAPASPEALLIQATLVRGEALGWVGRLADSLTVLERAVTAAAALGDPTLEGEARTYQALRLHQASRLEEAVATGERSLALHAGGRSPRTEGRTRVMLALARGNLGQLAEARADAEAGRRIVAALGDSWTEGIALAKLAHLDQELGRFQDARFYYEASFRSMRDAGDIVFEAVCQCYFATLLHEQALAGVEGAADEARRAYTGGLSVLDAARLPYYEGLFRGFLGALEAAFGAADEALAAFDRADLRLAQVGTPSYRATLDLLRGALDHRRAAQGDPEAATALATRRERAAPFAGKSMHVRAALRMLADRPTEPPAPAPAEVWTIGPESRWFAPPRGPAVSLGRRGAVRRILEALVAHRLAAPGAALTLEALIAAGWPGERIQHEAALRRARTAIAELRGLGLRDLLQTRDDGYLLDPSTPLARADRDAP